MATQRPSSSTEHELSNVMYIGRFPHGFYEDQMRAFFAQFGEILNLRISRNKKTGASKHYAYVQFATPEVAAIVADAMQGHMLMKQKLRCNVLHKGEVHPELWKGANRKFRTIPRLKLEMQKHNKPRTPEEERKRLQRALKRDARRAQMLADAGIDYSYQPLAQLTGAAAAQPAAIEAAAGRTPNGALQGAQAAAPRQATPPSRKRRAAALEVKVARAKGRLADAQPALEEAAAAEAKLKKTKKQRKNAEPDQDVVRKTPLAAETAAGLDTAVRGSKGSRKKSSKKSFAGLQTPRQTEAVVHKVSPKSAAKRAAGSDGADKKTNKKMKA